MKILVLGLGLQGKAVVHDLEQSSLITEIFAADIDAEQAQQYIRSRNYRKTRVVYLDATQNEVLTRLVKSSGVNLVICMLPPEFGYTVAQAAIETKISFVSSSYTGKVAELAKRAERADVTILPEMGLDPGIDLILCRLAVDELDEVHGLYSYGGGIPEPACANDNPLHYKITWTFEGVLKAYQRPARLLKDGREQAIAANDIFREEHIHRITIPEFGSLEAYPNGDAIHYIERFGLQDHIKEMGRFALRWPGHCQFWRTMVALGFLEDTPLADGRLTGLPPRQFLIKHLTPRLQFRQHERDVVILRIMARGLKNGRKMNVTYDLLDYRDLQTGLFAMNRTVGFTVSIAAQMILAGKITTPGLLSPTRDVPHQELVQELRSRNMLIRREESQL